MFTSGNQLGVFMTTQHLKLFKIDTSDVNLHGFLAYGAFSPFDTTYSAPDAKGVLHISFFFGVYSFLVSRKINPCHEP